MNAIEVKGLTKTYPQFTLDHIDLIVPKGSIVGLIGENGAGKSTLIRLLLGAARADEGEWQLLGAATPAQLLIAKQDIGVVLDEGCFPEGLSALQMGKIFAGLYRRWEPDTYAAYLERFDLPEKKPFKDYSRGMKMKLAMAVALSHQAKLLILDEATGGLDPVVRDEILDILYEFTRDEQHSILISSHILSDLEKLCDYVAFLHKGKLLFCEEKDRLLEQYVIVRSSEEQLQRIAPQYICGLRRGRYGVEALLRREDCPAGMESAAADMEDIMLFLTKGGAQ